MTDKLRTTDDLLTEGGSQVDQLDPVRPYIVIGSPVRQKPEILKLFLESLLRLDDSGFDIEFMFVDDNTDPESSKLLNEFEPLCTTVWKLAAEDGGYVRLDHTHVWPDSAVWKVAGFKDYILDQSPGASVFLIDSDVLVHPQCLQQLVAAKKDIVSCVYWTSWHPGTAPMPQVWQQDQYSMSAEFIEQMRVPGLYEVGGLGACTLLSSLAIREGVSFDPIPNVSFWGEDRHFCIRALALRLSLWADTHLPAYHIYRDSDLPGAYRFMGLPEPAVEPATVPADTNTSRYFTTADECVQSVIVPLHPAWWSRGREYAWAQKFAAPEHTVLDAACGISHPFKFWLAKNCASVHACDLDTRITDDIAILLDITKDLGRPSASIIALENLIRKVVRRQENLVSLRYEDEMFDRVFCLSVLEHMNPDDVLVTLKHFHRILKPLGMAVLTFDAPPMDPNSIRELFELSGFTADEFDATVPKDALTTTMYGAPLRCFRAALRKTR